MTDPNETTPDEPFVWFGLLDPTPLRGEVVAASHRLADAAKMGNWPAVFDLLDNPEKIVEINWWRPGGPAWFTPLHQAAWHGAPAEVAGGLIRRGALRSLRDSRGRTAYDIRCQNGLKGFNHPKGVAAQHGNSLELRARYLKPPPSPLPPATIRALDRHLAGVIDRRIRVLYDGRDPRQVLRYPPVEILHEVPGHRVWVPVPGMYGGFAITLVKDFLEVTSWCWHEDGSGQHHLITAAGAVLVAERFC